MPGNVPLYVAAALTLLVLLGYLLGENNFLFRIATYIFVGVAAGYVFVLVIYQVIAPRVLVPIASGDLTKIALVIVPVILSLLLVFKIFPRFSSFGNVSIAYLVGAGAAVAIGGAVLGTLISQARTSIYMFDLRGAANFTEWVWQLTFGLFMLLGTVSALAYFNFGARLKPNQPAARPVLVRGLSQIGQIFIALTLGSLFAGVFTSAITAMIERLGFLWSTIQSMIF